MLKTKVAIEFDFNRRLLLTSSVHNDSLTVS